MADLGSSEDSTWSVLLLNDDHTPMWTLSWTLSKSSSTWISKVQGVSCSAFIMKELPSAGLTHTKWLRQRRRK
jgi:hypothetical protein